jgi:hypothetical protein
MAETSVYFVPEAQDQWSGRGEELVDRLWEIGVIVSCEKNIARWKVLRETGESLPECAIDIAEKYADIGVTDNPTDEPVPNYSENIRCPACEADLLELTLERWDEDSEFNASDRMIQCPKCGTSNPASGLDFAEPKAFAKFYLFVSDCDLDEWDPNFRKALEGIVGPCQEYWEVAT